MFQFWFNTFFISEGPDFDEGDSEPTLKINRSEPDNWWFEIPKVDIDKAHKDVRNKVFSSSFKVCLIEQKNICRARTGWESFGR